jgi:hypothetical protein
MNRLAIGSNNDIVTESTVKCGGAVAMVLRRVSRLTLLLIHTVITRFHHKPALRLLPCAGFFVPPLAGTMVAGGSGVTIEYV